MNRVPFSMAEKKFIWENRYDLTYSELASKVSSIYGIKRSLPTIHRYITRREEAARLKSVPAASFLFTRNLKPEITNRRLVCVMTETDTTLFDIAAAVGLDIDYVRGLIAMGGIPKLYAKPVRDFYEDMGIVV